ncbi:transcription antitermination factor NusB [Piscinibacter sakaiensis]|uniref:Transcription antitermination protein NusB n=1 Tax=Piscinibacter sakaiensis TaxID=1547922 RepID=A0A0K8P3T5_PISS1|nr:transcription antitermination factor NusB [Piscinibacter sakaiensis]GAP36895.1 transcription termination protein NusB [Piscinibacter sakaiensis]
MSAVPPPDAPAGAPAPAPRRPAGKRAGGKSPRRRSRELAVQGLYEWLLSGSDAGVIDAHMREQEAYAASDTAFFDALLHGCIREAAALDAALARHVDRPTRDLSPVEHAVLLIGAWELANGLEVPYKVVINEGVELAKAYGGTDGHKYVNGVLDKVAADLRRVEVEAARAQRAGRR